MKIKLKVANVWSDGLILLAILWDKNGFGICLFSFVFGIIFEDKGGTK